MKNCFQTEVFMSQNKMTTNEVVKLLLNKGNEMKLIIRS